MLVGAPLACATHAGLDFIEKQERAGGVAKLACGLQEFFGDEVDAAFALKNFDGYAAYIG